MKRRDFIESVSRTLFALAGASLPLTMAAENAARSNGLITLFLGGDVMTGRGIDQILPNPGDPLVPARPKRSAVAYVEFAEKVNGPIPRPVGFSYIWGDAIGVLDQIMPDVRIVNLETSITISRDYWPRKRIHYRMHPENTPCITAAGIDCCTLANNHVLDWGYAGLAETLGALEKAGVHTAGAGNDLEQARAPAVLDLGAKGRVLVFSAGTNSSGIPPQWAASAEHGGVDFIEDLTPDSARRIAWQVKAVKQPGDIVVVSIHWGGNWGYDISGNQREFAHLLVDEAEVDVIHGHSSHHPMGVEVYRNRPIIYGCGDLLNDYEGIPGHEEYRKDLSLMYFATINSLTGKLVRFEMVPMRTRRFQINRASAEEAGWLHETTDREGAILGTGVSLDDDLTLRLNWE